MSLFQAPQAPGAAGGGLAYLRSRFGALNAPALRYASLVILLVLATPALAVNPDEMLKDPAQEHRARELGRDLRCLVCQNQSIDDSDADLAKDLRVIVRERISAGDSDDMVRKFVVDRYGDYVLLKPPFKGTTMVLWLGPFALFVGALAVIVGFYRRRRTADAAPPPPPLSAEEQRRLTTLLKESDR